MTGASRAPAEQRLDDCRADRHVEYRFDEHAEPNELHELAAGGRALHLILRLQRKVPLLGILLCPTRAKTIEFHDRLISRQHGHQEP